ncbi:MAG: biotin/lipoyl-binding protein [Alphaproteobacteria bacterium]|nr:biotin/lipoyl-binding protein [Alphaproteobacteria bacterium]
MLLFNKPLFREEAVASKWKTESFDALLRVTAPHEWMIVAGFLLGLLCVLGWGVFGSVERSVLAECVLARLGERHAVFSEVAGTVAEVLVEAGDEVEAGQAIARMRLPELRRQARIARTRVALLETRLDGSAPIAVKERDALLTARVELLEAEAIATAGELAVSPHAGEVTALDVAPGQAVVAGTRVALIRTGVDDRLEAFAFVMPDAALRLETGLAGRVLIAAPGGGSSALEADVGYVSPRPTTAPAWLAELGLVASVAGHLVRLTLRETSGAAADGTRCWLDIVTQRHAPVLLLTPSRTG